MLALSFGFDLCSPCRYQKLAAAFEIETTAANFF
jgi:hypothetical protein